jgi:hypothetical protein
MDMVCINERRKLVKVALDKDVIQEAPAFDNNLDITPKYEDRVYRYFELERQSSSSGRGWTPYAASESRARRNSTSDY